MSTALEFLAAAEPLWEEQAAHPFVRGLADGTLSEERFRRWLLQDYRYLLEFARALGYAAARVDRPESMAWYARVLNLTLNTEMDLHRRFAKRFGLEREDLETAPVWPTTRAYSDFLVRVAATGKPADVPAVLLPCEWGYLDLASSIAKEGAPPDPRYAEWVAQYTSTEYRDAVEWLKAEFDRLTAGIAIPERERLLSLFLTSARYELRFFDMCWYGEPT